jgi:putative phosphoribosyl transferase
MGRTTIEPSTVAALGLGPADIEQATARVRADIERRMALYRVPPLGRFLPGPGVVPVDDGLATGLTMQTAVAYARRHGAREVGVAVPCDVPDCHPR